MIEPDGWMHTGDLATMDEDGAVFIVDRKKDMINTGGFKVFPAEIEQVIAAHPSVAMVAVAVSRTSSRVRSPRPMLCSSLGRTATPRQYSASAALSSRPTRRRARSVRGRPAENLRPAKSCGASSASSTPERELQPRSVTPSAPASPGTARRRMGPRIFRSVVSRRRSRAPSPRTSPSEQGRSGRSRGREPCERSCSPSP